MDFAANFTAIDFETASRRPDSACQLAAVAVRDGQIAEKRMWMIRPEPLYFSRGNIRIHGITPEQVRAEPAFGELWADISQTFGDDCLVAHNASFDIGVLLACLRTHDQSIPELNFTCTRAIARRTWPHHRRYGLKPLAQWLGIRFRHHDALEDSIACAKILLAAGIDREAESLPDLEKKLRLRRGAAGQWGYRGPTGRIRAGRATRQSGRHSSGQSNAPQSNALPFLYPNQSEPTDSPTINRIDFQRLLVRAEFIRPLSGMQIVISGRLRQFSQQEAASLAQRLGGRLQQEVDDHTDLVVLGSGDEPAREKAQQLKTSGTSIRIVAEEEFLGLIVSGDA